MLDQPDIHPLFYGAPDSTDFRKLASGSSA